MKLVKGIVAAAMMTLACVGAASATSYYSNSSSLMLTAWAGGDLTPSSSQEIGMFLADTTEFKFANTDNYTKVGTIDPTLLTAGSYALSDLKISVYGIDTVKSLSSATYVGTSTQKALGTELFATNSSTAPTSFTAGVLAPFNQANTTVSVASYYKSLDLANDGVVDGDSVTGLVSSLNNYADFGTKLSVTSLSNVGSSDVIMYLYAADYSQRSPGYALINGGNALAKVKITSNGDVFVTSAVPVPGAVWLMGSALLGAVGLRRKNA